MNAKDLIAQGDLINALGEAKHDVRANPTDLRRRTLLFELLCFAAEYTGAERQLDVIAQLDQNAETGVQFYRNALAAERLRARLRSDGLSPSFILNPPPFAQLHLEAFNRLREGNAEEARTMLERAAQAQEPARGEVHGQLFNDISDSDPFLGPVLELIIHDRYIWLPFIQIKRLRVATPRRFRDLLWIPTELESLDGSIDGALVPVLYCGTSSHTNDQVRLGRATDWVDVGNGLMRGYGQRMLLFDQNERSILGAGEITLNFA